MEAIGICPQKFGIAVLGGSERQPKLARIVENPRGDPVGVLTNQCALARRDIQPVEVVPGFVPIIEAHINHRRIGSWNIYNPRARP